MNSVNGLSCRLCGAWDHLESACRLTDQTPLETRPHNGPYQGKTPVRTIPPGVMGADINPVWKGKSLKGHAAQSRNAFLNRIARSNATSRQRAARLSTVRGLETKLVNRARQRNA